LPADECAVVDGFDKTKKLEAKNCFLRKKVADLEKMLQEVEDSKDHTDFELGGSTEKAFKATAGPKCRELTD
jgi:hypothetical protein